MVYKKVGFMLAVGVLVTGCGAGQVPIPTLAVLPTLTAVPTDTMVPTDTAMPTDTPLPTDTAVPTDTMVPTDTAMPTGTPVPTDTLVPTVRVLRGDEATAARRNELGRMIDDLLADVSGVEASQSFAGDGVVSVEVMVGDGYNNLETAQQAAAVARLIVGDVVDFAALVQGDGRITNYAFQRGEWRSDEMTPIDAPLVRESNGTIVPGNCATARAMGLNATEAAAWSHLDRDADEVGCYGD